MSDSRMKRWAVSGIALLTVLAGSTACAYQPPVEPQIGLDSTLPADSYAWSAPLVEGWEAGETGYVNAELGCVITPTALPGDEDKTDAENTQALADQVFEGKEVKSDWLPVADDRQIEALVGEGGNENSQGAVRVTQFATLVVVASCDTAEQFEELGGTVASALDRAGITLESTSGAQEE